jgi:hypothetical protein
VGPYNNQLLLFAVKTRVDHAGDAMRRYVILPRPGRVSARLLLEREAWKTPMYSLGSPSAGAGHGVERCVGWCRRDLCRSKVVSLRRPTGLESDVLRTRLWRLGETRGARAASRAYRRRSSTAGLAFAARRGPAAPLHTPSARRSHVQSNACAPSGHGSGAGSCRAASRCGHGDRRVHTAPSHIDLCRAHVGLFRN